MPLTMLVKPASGACNLRCRYCFYREELSLRERGDRGIMTWETASALLRAARAREDRVCFAFQGGEPMLAGLDFFRRFTGEARRLWPDAALSFSIQTNGTLIDRQWAEFFAREGYLVGLSLDGPRDIHNKNRDGSFEAAAQGLALLRQAGAQVNVLTVVTAQMAKRPEAVYAFLKKQGILWQQFIPCMAPLEDGAPAPWALTGAMWGSFLCRLFDLWYADFTAGIRISNRLFENWVGMLAGLPPEECGLSGSCAVQYAVEADGTVYPCDFCCLDPYALGNVCRDSLDAMDARREAMGFLRRGDALSPDCRVCGVYALCRGGCPRYRDGMGKHLLCSGFKTFFDYAGPRLRLLTRYIHHGS